MTRELAPDIGCPFQESRDTILPTFQILDPSIKTTFTPGEIIGTWKSLRVQGFVIDPESIGVLKEIKHGLYDGNRKELLLFA